MYKIYMHMYIKTLQEISDRYAPSRILSFNMVHVLKALQLIDTRGHISRNSLCKELNLGEGSIKTLVKHLKTQNIIETSNAGTRLSKDHKKYFAKLLSCIPAECTMPICSIAIGKFNYAVLLRLQRFTIRSGIEQRDEAIKMGAISATTLLYKDNKFIMPGETYDSLDKEPCIQKILTEQLQPIEGDIIIVASAIEDEKIAEFSAKSAALWTIMDHENHSE